MIQPPDWAMYPYDALKLVENALSSSRALGAPLLNQLNGGAQIIGANGDSRAYNADYHEGVSPADMYFARFEGFTFVPVEDDPLSGSLPRVNQLAGTNRHLAGRSSPARTPTCRACPCRRGCRSRACRAALGVADVDRRRQAGERRRAGDHDLAGELQRVAALSVPSTVTRSAWPSPPAVIGIGARLMSTSCDAGAAQVADRERVGAAAGDRVDLLEVRRARARRRRRCA